ncbi:hypothetical protein RsoM2USA_98 [Ralstonia phage RsoM2USA]|nr:hypothetical protein RsoM2USA_98 [Ralstonia phage RsoM2USA]
MAVFPIKTIPAARSALDGNSSRMCPTLLNFKMRPYDFPSAVIASIPVMAFRLNENSSEFSWTLQSPAKASTEKATRIATSTRFICLSFETKRVNYFDFLDVARDRPNRKQKYPRATPTGPARIILPIP